MTVNNLQFGIANQLPNAYDEINADGVLGLGTISKDGFESPFVQMVDRGSLPHPIVSIFIPRILKSPVLTPSISIGTEDFENCELLTEDKTARLVANRNWAFKIFGQFSLLSDKWYNATVSISLFKAF